ncbi:MAG: glycerol acyltransferase [Bacteroidales bacterium]|nr:glycerol acyltransferase [Bacteroidales bacterium]
MVMSKLVERVIATTVKNFSYDGVSNLVESKGKFLAMSNHRDIILDPAISNLVMFRNGIMMSEIAVGSNLITNDFIEALIRSNRMVKVVRGITARELYLSSRKLSEYIRLTITSGNSSIWLAQRQGRTKDGLDLTEQGLLKMLDMSGTKSFNENFAELNIIPFSISYEFEPCDILKAREMMISRREKYVKQPGEDWASIMYGINQWKGNVHLNIGKPLSEQELAVAAMCDKNDRYQNIRHFVDLRVIDGYRLWNNNFIAYDLRNHTYKYSDRYTAEDKEAFVTYMEKQLDTVEKELNRDELRSIFLDIYANPIVSKQMLSMTF